MGFMRSSKSRFGEVFGRTWDVFFANFWQFFLVNVVLMLGLILLVLLNQYIFFSGTVNVPLAFGILFQVVIFIVMGAVMVAALYYVAKKVHGGGSTTLRKALTEGFTGWWHYTLLVLRVFWYVVWPVLVAGLVLWGLFMVFGSSPEALAQAPEVVDVGASSVTLEDIDFGELNDFDWSGSEGEFPALSSSPLEDVNFLRDLISDNLGNVLLSNLAFFVIIGLILWRSVNATFAMAAFTEKGSGVNAALKKSIEMVRGHWWKVFGNLFFLYVLGSGLFALVTFAAGILSGILLWLFGLIGLGFLNLYFVPLLLPLILAGFSGGLGVLFHYELFKKL